MKLRQLEEKDAKLMLEWMHDDSVVHDLYTDFSKKTIDDCEIFIKNSKMAKDSVDLAIVDEEDIYMGTVSLKHIDRINRTAEFAITVRKSAMGRGYSITAMHAILNKAKTELGLERVYWCVSEKNTRAVKFYNKNGFKQCEVFSENILAFYSEEIRRELLWYLVEL